MTTDRNLLAAAAAWCYPSAMTASKQKLVSQAELGRLAGVSRNSIAKACRPGKALEEAVVDKRVDMAHPAAVAYIKKHGGDPDPKPASVPYGKRGGYAARQRSISQAPLPDPNAPADVSGVPERIEPFADMTLRELITRFGTETAFKDWLSSAKAIEDIREKRIKNAEREGELVPREMVSKHVLGAFEAAHINLLTDGAQTIATRVAAMSKAGHDEVECQKFVADTMSKMIKAAKDKAARALKNA